MGIDVEIDGGIKVTNTDPPPVPRKWNFFQNPADAPDGAQKRYLWCISRETLEELKRHDDKLAVVLIVTIDERGRETRSM